MDENPPKILIVLLYAVIQLFDVTLIQEAQDLFLELPAALAGDDFDKYDFFLDGFIDDPVQF